MNQFFYFFEQGFYQVIDWHSYYYITFLLILTATLSVRDWIRCVYLISLFTISYSISLLITEYNILEANARFLRFWTVLVLLFFAVFNVFSSGNNLGGIKKNIQFVISIVLGVLYGFNVAHNFDKLVGNNNKFISVLEFSVGIEVGLIVIGLGVLLVGMLIQTVFRFSKRDYTLVVSSIAIGLLIPLLIGNKIW